jgi:hypothetical protein
MKKNTDTKPSPPPCVTPEVVSKLEIAFACGCPVTEACQVAGIARNTYYNFLKARPEYEDRFQALRDKPVLEARKRIAGQIPEDTKTAQWYLERKRPDEFSPKATVQHQHTMGLSDAELVEKILQLQQQAIDAGYAVDADYTEIDEQKRLPRGSQHPNQENGSA